jgi:hypothetical protein
MAKVGDVPVAEVRFREKDVEALAPKDGTLKTVKVTFIDGSSQSWGDVTDWKLLDDGDLVLTREELTNNWTPQSVYEAMRRTKKVTKVRVLKDDIRWFSVTEEVGV